jgi:putative restriction endonuclease
MIGNIEDRFPIYFIEQEKEEEDEIENKIRNSSRSEMEKQQLINARRGQGKFRTNLCEIEKKCRLTGVHNKDFLIASHIKPWRYSTDLEKIDGNNGFLLSPHIDKLFDGGYISFTDEGNIIRANLEVDQIMRKWGLDPDMSVGKFNPEQKKYLAFHRKMNNL